MKEFSIEHQASVVLNSHEFDMFYRSGGGILLFGFMLSLLIEWYRLYSGERPDWFSPVVRIVMVATLIGVYPFIIELLAAGFSGFGEVNESARRASEVFAHRQDQFIQNLRMGEKNQGILDYFTNNLQSSFLVTITFLLKYITLGLLHSLKFVQSLILKLLVVVGPLMISLGAIPGPFRQFPMNWFMMLFGVSFWSVVMKYLLETMAVTNFEIPLLEGVSFGQEIIYSITWIFLILCVPALSTALIFGRGFSGVFNRTAGLLMAGSLHGASMGAKYMGGPAAIAARAGGRELLLAARKIGGKFK